MCLEKAGPLPTPIVFKEPEVGLPVPENLGQLMPMSTVSRPTPTEPKTVSVILGEADLPVPKPLGQLMRAEICAVSGPVPMEPAIINIFMAKGGMSAP